MALHTVELFACWCRRWGPCNHRIGVAVSVQFSSVTERHSQSDLIYGLPAGGGKFRVNASGFLDFELKCRRFPEPTPPISLLVGLELLVICLVMFSSGFFCGLFNGLRNALFYLAFPVSTYDLPCPQTNVELLELGHEGNLQKTEIIKMNNFVFWPCCSNILEWGE